ncbi:L-rhamnose mutarotase [Staphylococcus nepalensis]|uniref:L-rhamnose mutarotase n=1 Tax=Staphylococcus nepalensis TaxID=214473 RepID=A0A380GJP3_9STAP|nr:L-rhamnose mutarotase [Staphylococcus nepalensis]POA00319.1 L-rhamnose mutarotase [Staphylococcus nepalensis]GGB90178.1 L-rhamnose mutarotase [Staphylococcus nepalensis]SUM53825.1 L-rhamnose mutarotase [Staphylococcus nepalensis]VDG65751.1 L-rhamnose mutarotase [Lacrimispora indolis]
MPQLASVMYVKEGCHAEYKRRHDEIWPEMKQLLKDHGVSDYHIYLNEHTGELFSVLTIEDETLHAEIAQQTICRQWWDYMADIMNVNDDNSPKSIELTEVFFLE